MPVPDAATTAAADLDRALGFAIPSRSARGRLVRLGPALDAVLAAHAYPPAIEGLLAEALAVCALLGSTLKDAGGQLTMQAQTDGGAVRLLVCDYRGGELRGYVDYDAPAVAGLGDSPALPALFGTAGYLAITFDLASTGERYQGIVPLDGESIGEAAQSYFVQSEQIPSMVRVGVARRGDRRIAGGLFLQHLPEGEEGRERLHTRLDHPEWEHVAALGATTGADELCDPALPLESLIWRLFNEEEGVRVLASTPVARGCRCTPEHIAGVLSRFPVSEQREMADADGLIRVDCAFCATSFPFPVAELAD